MPASTSESLVSALADARCRYESRGSGHRTRRGLYATPPDYDSVALALSLRLAKATIPPPRLTQRLRSRRFDGGAYPQPTLPLGRVGKFSSKGIPKSWQRRGKTFRRRKEGNATEIPSRRSPWLALRRPAQNGSDRPSRQSRLMLPSPEWSRSPNKLL